MQPTRLWARQNVRGQGIGDALVARFLQDARKAGYKRAVLRSLKDLKSAHKVYQKAGFLPMDGHNCFPGFSNLELAMVRNLP